jgi:DNA polymerase I
MSDRHYELFKQLRKERENRPTLNLHKNSNVLLIDGLNTFIRAWSAIPTQNENGEHIGGVTGFLKSVGYGIRQTSPTRVIVVFDGKDASASRKKIYSGYKEQRGGNALSRMNRVYGQLSDDDERKWMKRQLIMCANMLKMLPVTTIVHSRVESDDVMGYISRELCPERSVLMSSDKDFLQLVNETTSVWSPTKQTLYTPDVLFEEYGIPFENFLLFRMIDGDKSDNVSGIHGLGLKTLLKRFPIITEGKLTVEGLIEYAKEQDAGLVPSKKIKVYQTVIESVELLERNKSLMDLEIGVINSLSKLNVQDRFNAQIPRLNKRLFESTLSREGMIDSMPNVQSWLKTMFSPLDNYANAE